MAKYINADALREIWVWGKNDKYGYSECIPLKDLDDFPAADVRPNVRGEWKVTPVYIKCNKCGESFILIPQNFCPNCGADMKGEENEHGTE